MTEKKSLLLLRLEGMLQSWGEDSKWDYRDSAGMPTKSGVVGLLACAMGLERDDPQIAQLSQSIQLAVRADRPGTRFVDFQTVTGNPLITANGTKRTLGDTFISRRCYLQDASFLVAIETTAEWYERIVTALKAPKWCIYLGRKNCVPSRPVLESVDPQCSGLLDVMHRYPLAERAELPVSFECEMMDESMSSYTRADERRSGYRTFDRRTVWRGVLSEVEPCI